jgi:hypothetical protein
MSMMGGMEIFPTRSKKNTTNYFVKTGRPAAISDPGYRAAHAPDPLHSATDRHPELLLSVTASWRHGWADPRTRF